MGEIPDRIMQEVQDRWVDLGYNPIFVYRLLERGYLHCEIEYAMQMIVGNDWKETNASTWIDRIEAKHSGIFGDGSDDYPVIKVLDFLVMRALELGPVPLCEYCQAVREIESLPDEINLPMVNGGLNDTERFGNN